MTDQTVLLSLSETADISTLTSESLAEAFQASDCSRCRLDKDAFTKALKALKSDPHASIEVGSCVPAKLDLLISEDDMLVTARVTSPQGGLPLTVNEVLHELREKQVALGIRRAAIEKLIQHTEQADPGSTIEAVIARGKPPVNGCDTLFEKLVPDARQRVLRPKEIDGDRVDMRDLGEIISVNPGTPILKRIPATPGSSGFTVRGKVLEASPGHDRDFNPGVGTEISPSDSSILVATRQGLPCLVDNAAHIDDVLSMRKVDATTGHVNYDGAVLIQGNVGPGMRIIARGDVTVTGYVDSALIDSGGNVTVTKGVIGQQTDVEEDDHERVPDHSASIKAKGSIWVSYSQYASLVSEHGLIVDKQLTHCHVTTRGVLCLGGEGKEARGKLIGGIVDICNNLYAGQIGAPAGTRTCINISPPPPTPAYLAEQERITRELRDEIAEVNKLTKVRKKVVQEKNRPQLKDFLVTLDQKLENHRRNVTVLKIHAAELQKQDPQRQPVVVQANRVLYSGVIFQSESESKAIHENRGPSSLVLRHGSFSYQYVG